MLIGVGGVGGVSVLKRENVANLCVACAKGALSDVPPWGCAPAR